MIRQIAPRDAGPRNPENTIQNTAMVLWAPPPARPTAHDEGLKTGPFLIAHQSTDHGSFSQSYLESEP
jgi:hypothetical protein